MNDNNDDEEMFPGTEENIFLAKKVLTAMNHRIASFTDLFTNKAEIIQHWPTIWPHCSLLALFFWTTMFDVKCFEMFDWHMQGNNNLNVTSKEKTMPFDMLTIGYMARMSLGP